ncbi:MAG TPA: chemotaxis protein CheW [Candidatus Dormibacteraeota bacterium]|jgi:chemotaxis signal transduction protein|nr:chemotaxis protein CheW [Candidatus Dormibacteraeota bacterium]
MTIVAEIALESFVLLRLGERRFALKASQIVELIAPSRVFRFPHRTAALEGVILRRGRIIPVCDVSEQLVGKKMTLRRFYLIANRYFGAQKESIALPVSGDCELITAELTPRSESDLAHVAGWLSHGGDAIEILNLDALTPGPHATRPSVVVSLQPAEVRA